MNAKSHTAARAQAARKQQGLSKADLAVMMLKRGHAWTESTVTSVENDRKTMWSADEMADLADCLSASLLDLFPQLRRGAAPITNIIRPTSAPRGVARQQPVTAGTMAA